MTGIEAGKTWSRIGAEVAPTSSAASGVWGSLNEVSGYVGAGTWPAPYEAGYNFFGTASASSGQLITFTNIPQDAQDLFIMMDLTTANNQSPTSFIPNATSIGSTAAPGGFMFNNNGYSVGRKTNATTNAGDRYKAGLFLVTIYNYSSTTAAKGLFYQGGAAAQANTNTWQEWGFANYATLGSAAVTSFSILNTGGAMANDSFATVFGIGAKI